MKSNFLVMIIIFIGILHADSTFFYEDFNSSWSTDLPPPGWQIFYSPPEGPEDWHRASSGILWNDNLTGYAVISQIDARPDAVIDSLISPIIDCTRFREIVLRCSIYFRHQTGNYQAKILGSVDGGISYPYLVKDLYGQYYAQPQLETINLSWANESSQVRLAFVFEGPIYNLQFWCLDNISLVGEYIYDYDLAPVEIISPRSLQLAGPCTLRVKISNLGKETAENFWVQCSLYSIGGVGLHYAENYIYAIEPRETLLVSFMPEYNFSAGFYQIKFWTNLTEDENRNNDTLIKDFRVGVSEILNYSDNSPDSGLCFPVREQGWGVKFTPQNYPALINNVQCYLTKKLSTASRHRYKIRVVADDGSAGAPGSTIYESPINNEPFEGWSYTYLQNEEIYIYTGSVYIFYLQADDEPYAPLLWCDGRRDASGVYYKYYYDEYLPDYPPGDWLIRVSFIYIEPSRFQHDLRVVNIQTPTQEFILRPYNYQTPIRARIGNFGTETQTNFSVVCSIFSYIHGIPGETRRALYTIVPCLEAGNETIIHMGYWSVCYYEPVLIKVKVNLAIDQNPNNNYKIKICNPLKGKFWITEGDVGYALIDSDTLAGPAYNWYEPTNAYQLLDYGDDTIVRPPPLPFPFRYYDSTYRYLYVSTDGYITFMSNPSSNPNNESVPSEPLPNNALYVFWDDLLLPSDRSAKIYYHDYGTPPNRFRVITWHNVLRKNTVDTCRVNFQAILYESGDIIFQYKDLLTGKQWADYGKSATIGIENASGTGGLLYLYCGESTLVNWPENKLTPGRAIKFYRQIHDVAVTSIISPVDSIHPLPVTPTVEVKNYGTNNEDVVQIFLTIKDFYENIVYDTLIFYNYLRAGEEVLIHSLPWNAFSGQYVLICSTAISIDDNPTNNIMTKNILVAPWLMKPPVPADNKNRKVKHGAMAYAPDFRRIYVLKGNSNNEFYAYNLETGRWESLPRIPYLPTRKYPKAGCALTFGLGRKIFALKGGNARDFYCYDILDSSWSVLESIYDPSYYTTKRPKDGASISYSSYDGKIYAILGNNTKVLIRYTPGEPPQGNYWEYISQIPPEYSNENKGFKHGASLQCVDSIVYIFRGNGTADLLRYDLKTRQWLTKLEIPGARNKVKAGATSAYHPGTQSIYFFLGGNKQSLWRFYIPTLNFDSISEIPAGPSNRKIKSGAAIIACDENDPLYILKGTNTNEFWSFAFWAPETKARLTNSTPINVNSHDQTSSLTPPSIVHNLNTIQYSLPYKSEVELKLYWPTGSLVAALKNELQEAGVYTITLDHLKSQYRLKSGVYLLKTKISDKSFVDKVIIY
jgi:hypothetical protein